jgi:hypothetical protein
VYKQEVLIALPLAAFMVNVFAIYPSLLFSLTNLAKHCIESTVPPAAIAAVAIWRVKASKPCLPIMVDDNAIIKVIGYYLKPSYLSKANLIAFHQRAFLRRQLHGLNLHKEN